MIIYKKLKLILLGAVFTSIWGADIETETTTVHVPKCNLTSKSIRQFTMDDLPLVAALLSKLGATDVTYEQRIGGQLVFWGKLPEGDVQRGHVSGTLDDSKVLIHIIEPEPYISGQRKCTITLTEIIEPTQSCNLTSCFMDHDGTRQNIYTQPTISVYRAGRSHPYPAVCFCVANDSYILRPEVVKDMLVKGGAVLRAVAKSPVIVFNREGENGEKPACVELPPKSPVIVFKREGEDGKKPAFVELPALVMVRINEFTDCAKENLLFSLYTESGLLAAAETPEIAYTGEPVSVNYLNTMD